MRTHGDRTACRPSTRRQYSPLPHQGQSFGTTLPLARFYSPRSPSILKFLPRQCNVPRMRSIPSLQLHRHHPLVLDLLLLQQTDSSRGKVPVFKVVAFALLGLLNALSLILAVRSTVLALYRLVHLTQQFEYAGAHLPPNHPVVAGVTP